MPKRSQALISTDREVAAAKCPAEGRVVAEYRIAGTPDLVLRVTAPGTAPGTPGSSDEKTSAGKNTRSALPASRSPVPATGGAAAARDPGR